MSAFIMTPEHFKIKWTSLETFGDVLVSFQGNLTGRFVIREDRNMCPKHNIRHGGMNVLAIHDGDIQELPVTDIGI